MEKRKNRRRNYFIRREFQTKFILKFCGLVVLGSLISGVMLYRFSEDTMTTTFVDSRLSIVNTADYILPALFGSSLVTIILLSIATAVVVMYLSHRIAGPLFKIERSLKELAAGDLTVKIRLRSTDEIAEMANCVNEMAGSFNQRLSGLKMKLQELGKQIDNLTALSETRPSFPPEMQETLKELCAKKKELDQAIAYFKVEK